MNSEKKQLLVVDDSPLMTLLYRSIVTYIDCPSLITESYGEAMQFCSNHRVDVLISDLHIGRQLGFDIIRQASTNPKSVNLKSFICSAESPVRYKEVMAECHVNGWIIKPIDIPSFRRILERLVRT